MSTADNVEPRPQDTVVEAAMNEAQLHVTFDDKGKTVFQLTHGNETITTTVTPLGKQRSQTVVSSSSGEEITRKMNVNQAQAIESVFGGSLKMMLLAFGTEYTRRFNTAPWWDQEPPTND